MSKQQSAPVQTSQQPAEKRSWRDDLTPDEREAIDRAASYAEFWKGVHNLHVNILIDKLAKLLDERDGK